MKIAIEIRVNGEKYDLEVKPNWTLLDVLRYELGLTGAKKGCGSGKCGCCTVLMNGKPIDSCLLLAVQANGAEVVTIEGLAAGDEPHPLQAAFVEKGAIQCGFCTPGTILTAKALLDTNPDPQEHEIKAAIAGNLCRCTGYTKIIEAVQHCAASRSE
ncbi:MAG: (2Fe-2S)-binding protein [Pseudomonadota bacterium]